jgi:hypothetical protein
MPIRLGPVGVTSGRSAESRLVHQKYGNPNVPSSKVKLHELIAAFLQEGINANKPPDDS